MKRGLASPWVHSALPITRRSQSQRSSVRHVKSRNRPAGFPVAVLSASAAAGSFSSVVVTTSAILSLPILRGRFWAAEYALEVRCAPCHSTRSELPVPTPS